MTNIFIKNHIYDKLKFIAQIVLPAISASYFALASIWGLPAAEQVVGTIAVIDVFLGSILGLSTKGYNASEAKYDGNMVFHTDPGGVAKYSLELNNAESFANKNDILFKVVNKPVNG
jgi:hypothetical protein